MKIIGLTGSIGMGKSTTAGLFAEEGVPVNDADRVVHELYAGKAVLPLTPLFPDAIVDGKVNREKLSVILRQNPAKFAELEAIVHPLVREREEDFLLDADVAGADLVVLDIPLLFETGAFDRVDYVVVVSCGPDLQRQRVLARPGMTPEKFEMILARQTPDSEKRERADFVIDTSQGIDVARQQVRDLLSQLREQKADGNDA
ncbi:dephospho-CoA kinase [Peteryoungia desertarenae]|uniref:Dephospho-CoA kinase n=1 Tax=Peteryoungia desertarenae TaxID=1813451 RepID=A0ABX6QK60_9HYPH|nr:dephospho-CoA kinase [Peteryoungia desertarenae]QLF68862.1 dephospho-CoA kinase [Peteryoungia desertarenae]